MSYFKKFVFAVMFVVATLLVVTFSVSASGPVTRWMQPGTVVYSGPDQVADVVRTITATVPVSVTFMGNGWANIFDVEEYVQTSNLLKEEPAQVTVAREQATLDATSVGNLTWAQLKELLSGLGFVPAASQPVSAAQSGAGTVAALPATNQTYVVVSGDSLSAIAARYGISWVDLAKANNVVPPYVISVGQVLTIPSSGTVAAAPATASGPTNFGPRDCLVVNDTKTCLEGQDLSDVRAMFHTETGIAQGKQFIVNVPKGWSLGVFGVSAEIVAEGGKPIQYTGGPALIIRGPWKGQIGAYEAGLHGVPVEWEDFLATTIFASHRKYVPAAKLVYLP